MESRDAKVQSMRLHIWSNRAVYLVLFLALAIRLYAIWDYKLSLNLHSDDQGYLDSAINLLRYGRYTYYNPNFPTLHMMPGITFLLAGVLSIFGTGTTGILAAKVVMSIIGTVGLYGVFLIARYVWNPTAGLIAVILGAVYLPGIETDTLLLTESPFMALIAFMLYFTIRVAHERKNYQAVWVAVLYVAAVFFRPTVALYPVLVVLYLLFKRYPKRLLAKQLGAMAVLVIALMSPWWIRNYHDFHHFVPLTDGTGNPLLLGTYQGEGYPSQVSMNQLLAKIEADNPQVLPPYAHEEAWMNLQKQAAIDRMKQWWETNPGSFIDSYAYLKPIKLWQDPFYWIRIFKVHRETMRTIQPYLVWSGIVGFFLALLRKPRAETVLFLLTLLYYTALYSVYFVFGRYSEPLMPFIFLGVGAGLSTVVAAVTGLVRSFVKLERKLAH